MEYIAGGEAGGMSPEDIAKKHGVDIKLVNDQIKMGIEVEYEHTKDPNVATEIAKDHLVESPFYYTYLEDMEEEMMESLKEDIETGMTEEEREEEEERKGRNATPKDAIEFLKLKPNPTDEQLHEWCEENGIKVPTLEGQMYKLATAFVKSMEKEDSLQDYLDAAKKEEEKNKNGEKKKKEGEEEEEEEDPKEKKKTEGKKKKEEDDEEEKKKKTSKKEKKDSVETKEDIINRLFG